MSSREIAENKCSYPMKTNKKKKKVYTNNRRNVNKSPRKCKHNLQKTIENVYKKNNEKKEKKDYFLEEYDMEHIILFPDPFLRIIK